MVRSVAPARIDSKVSVPAPRYQQLTASYFESANLADLRLANVDRDDEAL